MKKIFLSLILSSHLLGSAMQPFSLEKLDHLENFKLQDPSFIAASDNTKLAYYAYIPKKPTAVVIFYHGAGFYGSSLYQNFAKELAEKHSIGCYIFDIRGHGNSEGNRGDAPSITQVWNDTTSAVNFVTEKHPNAPLYLGGHSSGAGMVLNYSNYYSHPAVKGYLFVAPYLGRNSGTLKDHADTSTSFVKSVRIWVFILNGISRGYLCAHIPAIYFNYPDAWIKKYPKIVTHASATMLTATAPENPQELFSKINKPCVILTGEHDEQFIPEKIVAYIKEAPAEIRHQSTAQIVPDAKHLDILLSSPDYCAQFINDILI